MKVTRDFERIYRTEDDPWNIGAANSDRYQLYADLIVQQGPSHRQRILDIGCGSGAFLAKFKTYYDSLVGIELSKKAIETGKNKFPFIDFIPGRADRLDVFLPRFEKKCDMILYNDVIYYLSEKGKRSSLESISRFLRDDGRAFLSAWCPGGNYLSPDEFERLVTHYFVILEKRVLESNHVLFVTRPRKIFLIVTVDYETWHPIPAGHSIDWDRDIFIPAQKLMDIFDGGGVKATFFVEMGEYFWLRENQKEIAEKMENQWREIIRRGHDVQLHLHPNWLPECGAQFMQGNWYWDWSKAHFNHYPNDADQLIKRCKSHLEGILKEVDPSYKVTTYRAGAYQAQPFKRLYDALSRNGILADSSVYAGGVSEERGYHYTDAYSRHQPYFASAYDPQLLAPPSERVLIEFPIFAYKPGQRWFLDGIEGPLLAERLLTYKEALEKNFVSSEMRRFKKRFKSILLTFYVRLGKWRSRFNKILSPFFSEFLTLSEPQAIKGDEYYVLMGHTKAPLAYEEIRENLRALKSCEKFHFFTMSEVVNWAKGQLTAHERQDPASEAVFQIQREYHAVLSDEKNEAQSIYLQSKIPLDRTRILDLGCGAGDWSAIISQKVPWANVTGVDIGDDFIEKANSKFSGKRTTFLKGDFLALPFDDSSFDCIYADNALEHSFDVQGTLHECFRVLDEGGCLLAAIPPDAYNPAYLTDNHTWKTCPTDVSKRLEDVGFRDIDIEEVDTFRHFGMTTYLPSKNKMMYIKAWKRGRIRNSLDRAKEIMSWVYYRLSPDKAPHSSDVKIIIQEGYALCAGYADVLAHFLVKEGFQVRRLTMLAKDHPKGRGEERIDSHEMVELKIGDETYLLDPTVNNYHSFRLKDLLKKPDLAHSRPDPDDRYKNRHYELYDGPFWFKRVYKYYYRTVTSP